MVGNKLSKSDEFIDNINIHMLEYDNALIRRLIRNIIALGYSKIEIFFYNRTVIEKIINFN